MPIYRPGQPGRAPVNLKSPGQEGEFRRLAWRHRKVSCIAPDDSQCVNQTAMKHVGLSEVSPRILINKLMGQQGIDGLQRVGRPYVSAPVAVLQLQTLNEILAVDQPPRTQLRIERSGSHQLPHLTVSHATHCGDVKNIVTVNP